MKVFSKLKTKRNVMLALIISFLMSGGIAFGEENNKPLTAEEETKVQEVIKLLEIERAKTLFELLKEKKQTDKIREIIKQIDEIKVTEDEYKGRTEEEIKIEKRKSILEKGEEKFSNNILKEIKDDEGNSIFRVYRSGVIEIGKDACMRNNVALNNDGIVIGTGAIADPYIGQPGSIAIGKKAYAETFFGVREQILNFKRTKFNKDGYNRSWPYDIDKTDTPIAIGRNSYASSGSVVLGQHTYTGEIGDINISSMENGESNRVKGIGIYSTVIGTNSFANGTLSTTTGAYSIMTSQYEGEDNVGDHKDKGDANPNQNLGAVINGTLNSIESKTADKGSEINKYSGIANSVVGFANKAKNSNGTMIFGAGNEITNSANDEIGYYNVDEQDLKKHPNSVKELADNLRKQYREGKVGGSTLVVGNGNQVDSSRLVSITGSNNTVIGSKNNIVSGYDNKITGSSNNIVYGSKYIIKKKAQQSRSSQDAGTQTEDPNGNILFGNNTENVEINVKNTVAIGNDIKPNLNNSVYLGEKATEAKDENTLWKKDNRDKLYNEYAGFDKIGGIVSVGGNDVTRIIQNVAPGLISPTSTDAINGSQLYNYVAKQYITVQDGKGNKTQVKLGDTLTLNGMTVSATVKKPETKSVVTSTTKSNNTTPVQPSNTKEPQNANKPQEHTAIFETDTFEYVLRKDGKEILLGKGPDSKLYPKEFLENNVYDFNTKKWKDKQGTEIKDVKSYSTGDSEVVLNTKYGNVIGNVSDGVKDNDVANMKQLKAVESKVDKNTSSITEINNNIVGIKKDINKVDKKADLALGGVSNAVAMANLVQVNSYSRHRHNLSAAYGYYGGSHALAIGFSGVNEKRNFVYKLSGSVNNKGNLALGLGVGVMLGKEDNDYPVNSKKVSMLEKDNKELKEKVSKLERMVTELLKRK